MSAEKIHDAGESGHEQLQLHETEHKHNNPERAKEGVEHQEHDHNLDKIHESIHREAVSASEVTVGEAQEHGSYRTYGVQKELKDDAYRRTIKKIRSRLNPVERGLSKVIHNPVIESVSEAASNTIGRPSAILGSGIFALIGSGVVLYMARQYGFSYNFTIFLVLLTGGFFAGLAIEASIRLIRRG